jgi:hypothetical protein
MFVSSLPLLPRRHALAKELNELDTVYMLLTRRDDVEHDFH